MAPPPETVACNCSDTASPSAFVRAPGFINCSWVIVQLNAWLTEKAPEVAVTVTVYGLPNDAPEATVPEMTPVSGAMLRPPGRPKAPKVAGSPLGSFSVTGSETASPSRLVWLGTGA